MSDEGISQLDEIWLDPEEFPFTRAEVMQAASLWCIPGTERQFTEEIANAAADAVQTRDERSIARSAPSSGVSGKSELSDFKICGYTQVYWLWPTLSVLPSCGERARLRIVEYWRYRLAVELLRARRLAAEVSGLIPKQALSRAEATALRNSPSIAAERASLFARAPRELPDATAEMRKDVSDLIDAQQRTWLAIAAEAQVRLRLHEARAGSVWM